MLPTIERQRRILNQHLPSQSSEAQSPQQRLADSLGLELSYESIWGASTPVPPASAEAIAEAIAGEPIDLDDETQIEAWLARRSARSRSRLCPQGTLVEAAASPLGSLRLNLDPDELASPISLTVRWENDAITRAALDSPLWTSQATPGYHRVQVQTVRRTDSFIWILHPPVCFFPETGKPLNGINCFLPSLRSARNWGCGDFTDLTRLAAHLRQHVPVDFIALNPLHAIHNRAPYNTSPYLPLSIFARNLLYLDVEQVPEFKHSPLAQRLVASPGFQVQLDSLRQAPLVDYEAIAKIKKFFLLLLYRVFRKSNQTTASPWVQNYCVYQAFDAYFHRRDPDCWHWRQWPEPYRRPDSPESLALREKLSTRIDFYAYVEMRIAAQLAATQSSLLELGYSLGLYHDLALATDRVGADYWAYQDLYAPGVRVGSPPDDFNEQGQDWGFPALHPQRHADSGFRYFIESIRCAAAGGGALRFDHVMRLARLYWIPDGMSASQGAYVRDRFEDLLGILALESQRGRFAVIGEDLGTVPGYFREALSRRNVLSYKLLLFERDAGGFRDAAHYPEQAIASFTTHDLPTFDGWLHGSDLRARCAAGTLSLIALESECSNRRKDIATLSEALKVDVITLDGNEFFAALCKFLASTPCRMRLINLEELSGEKEQQNLPGTTSEHPNWRRRFPIPLESLSQHSSLQARLRVWAASLRGGQS